MILLPGALHGPEDFLREGFAAAVQERCLALDLYCAELRFEDVASDEALLQLQRTLVEPARKAGYRQIWLVGISIGGYVALGHADRYPGHAQGLFLIAPYPGNRMTTKEIAQAGGIAAWQPESLEENDTERRNWHWLKHQREVEVHLGYGSDDRFAAAHRMMAEVLPPSQIDCVPGAHDWNAWRVLWNRFLDRRFGVAHV